MSETQIFIVGLVVTKMATFIFNVIFGLFIYWCFVSLVEKIKDKIDDILEKIEKKKAKKEDKKPSGKLHSDFIAEINSKRIKYGMWKKKNPVYAFLLELYKEIRCYYWYRVPDYPRDMYRAVKRFIQRGKRGWANEDTWGLCHQLSDVFIGSVKYLRKTAHGYPCGMVGTQGVALSKNDKGLKEWKRILGEIIWTFETAKKVLDHDLVYIADERYRNRYEKSGKFKVMTKDECKRYRQGWKYFQDYYFDLWD